MNKYNKTGALQETIYKPGNASLQFSYMNLMETIGHICGCSLYVTLGLVLYSLLALV